MSCVPRLILSRVSPDYKGRLSVAIVRKHPKDPGFFKSSQLILADLSSGIRVEDIQFSRLAFKFQHELRLMFLGEENEYFLERRRGDVAIELGVVEDIIFSFLHKKTDHVGFLAMAIGQHAGFETKIFYDFRIQKGDIFTIPATFV